MTSNQVPYESDFPLEPQHPTVEADEAVTSMPAAQLSLGRKAVVGATFVGTWAWSHTGYVLEISAGKGLEQHGMNGWLAAATIGAVTVAETFSTSYVATAGLGDFEMPEPKTRLSKAIASSAPLSPLYSLWNGAPGGVMIDQMYAREVTPKRRLVHALPYGAAVGLWVSPNPISEAVINTAGHAAEFVGQQTADHPAPSALVGTVLVAAAGLKLKNAWQNHFQPRENSAEDIEKTA